MRYGHVLWCNTTQSAGVVTASTVENHDVDGVTGRIGRDNDLRK
jgi:hypothetical protein